MLGTTPAHAKPCNSGILLDLVIVHHEKSSSSYRSTKEERAHGLSYVQSRRRQREARESPSPATSSTSSTNGGSPSQQPCRARKSSTVAKASKPRPSSSMSLSCTFPVGNASDPFQATCAASEPQIHHLLQLASSALIKSTFLAEAYAPASILQAQHLTRHDIVTQERLRQCTTDDALMYATLAYSATMYGWRCGEVCKSRPPEYYIVKARTALRRGMQEQIKRGQGDMTWHLLSIYSIAAAEFWLSTPLLWSKCPERQRVMQAQPRHLPNVYSVRRHLDTLQRLAIARGGWDTVDPYVLESAILVDKYLAITEHMLPVIALTWDPGSIPPPMVIASTSHTILELSTLCPGYGQDLASLIQHPDLLQVYIDSAEYVQTSTSFWARAPLVTIDAETWLFRRLQALIYRLLHLQGKLHPSDECTRLALLIFLLGTTDHQGPQVALEYLWSPLRMALMREGAAVTGIRLWCVCTAFMLAPSGSVEKSWLIDEVELCALSLGMDPEVGSLKAWVNRFLYYPERQQPAIEDLEIIIKARLRKSSW